ncbi:MAG: hypothetical protein EPO39_19295 [Candidatus Manganitrophaceae bacterium]|nr:MAG: hypothetical protein EPO39_19295 [Candidatus Manganitrophaceae bacterium]
MKKDAWLYSAAFLCGIATWVVVSTLSGRREAWDSELYFSMGMPTVCATSMILGFFEPKRSWRWGAVPMAGQFFWMLMKQGAGNLLPLGVIVFGLFSLPSIIAARFGAWMRTKWVKHTA